MKVRIYSPTRFALRNGRLARLADAVDAPPTTPLITLTDIAKNQTVYQRVVNSKPITVSGDYTGTAPAFIEARVLDHTSGTPMSNWTTLTNATISGGTYSGTFDVPQGGWYKLQVRDPANPGGLVTGTNKWGVGILVALLGQSNMDNLMDTPYNYPVGNPKSIVYDSGTFSRAGTVSSTLPPNANKYAPGYANVGEGFRSDGPTYLANFMTESLGVPVCLVEAAAPGQAIDVWIEGAKSAWVNFVNIINGIGGDFEMALWLQGESNAQQGTSTSAMVGYLGTLHSQLKNQTGRNAANLHFGIISLGPCSFAKSFSGNSDEKIGFMRAAHVQYANNTPGAFFVTSAHDTQTTDGIHINGEGFNRISRRYGKSAAARLGVGTSCAGPRVISATLSGSIVTLTVQHSGGTNITDGSGGMGSALTGFQFKDSGGNVLTYTSSITGPTTIQFTVSGTPVTVSYAMTNAPHSADPAVSNTPPVLSSCVYDNATYLNGNNAPFGLSAVGAPLQPLPPMAIS